MFTGIIEEVGKTEFISADKITIKCSEVLKGTQHGDSIAVNGVCLTVTKITNESFTADISPETIKITALSGLRKGSGVNLERALTLSSRLGGHIVSGHIDTTGIITEYQKSDDFYNLTVRFPKEYSKYTVKKGSITVNGISLTIADCGDDFVTIALIPHTCNMTVLNELKIGDNVNLEFDILAKYVEKNLLSRDNSNITVNFLAENGFV